MVETASGTRENWLSAIIGSLLQTGHGGDMHKFAIERARTVAPHLQHSTATATIQTGPS